jgi:calcium-translocating P-type ATPase
MKLYQLSADDALRSLRTSADGLSDAEAARRLKEFGPNQVPRGVQRHLGLRLLEEFTNFFAMILWLAAALSAWAAWVEPGQGMGVLAAAIVGVIVVNGLFSFWQVFKAERALAALERLLPHRVRAKRQGRFVDLPAAELAPGDLVSVQGGDLIPADCRLVEAFGVVVNNATVTGESVPLARSAEPCETDDPLHATNLVWAGTSLVAGEGLAVVSATGLHTEFGRIAHLTQTAGETSFPLQREIRYLSRLVAALAVALGVSFYFVGQVMGLSFWHSFMFAVGIIVANVPEGLLPTVTLSLAMAAQRMSKRNVLIRHLRAVETLGSATVICTDKTGTLTQNRMTARSLFIAGAWHGAGDVTALQELAGRHRRFFECAVLCQTLKPTDAGGTLAWRGDPLEMALYELGEQALVPLPDYQRVDELPFDSERRRLSTLHHTPAGLVLFTKGALENLLPLCSQVVTPAGLAPIDEGAKASLLLAQEELATGGHRVVALAWRDVPEDWQRPALEAGLTLAGLVGCDDPPRPEVPAAIKRCHAAGIKVIMVTGDHPQTALGVARQIGLVGSEEPVVIAGDQLRRLSNSQLQLALDAPEVHFARVSADQKLRIVSALQRKGHVVAVTGDGVNDAPALRKADIGIAMGASGADVARETADLVLADDNFASIVAAIEEGRAVFDNIGKFITYILTSNIPEILPYLAFVLLRIPLPLTIIQILTVDLGTDMLPALGLGAEPPDPEVMRRPPRSRLERLLTWPLVVRAYLFLGMMEALAALAAYFFVLQGGGWSWGHMIDRGDPLYGLYLQATTACLAAIVMMQVVNVFLCRSPRRSVFKSNGWGNRLIWLGVAVELGLIGLISYTVPGNVIFGTAPLPWHVWLFVIPFAAAMLILEEARKWLARRTSADR